MVSYFFTLRLAKEKSLIFLLIETDISYSGSKY